MEKRILILQPLSLVCWTERAQLLSLIPKLRSHSTGNCHNKEMLVINSRKIG